jgi:SAM-dependent methyltransferase
MDLIESSNSKTRHPWELARLEVVKDIINNKNSTFEGKNILDLGCGDLFFITEFSKKNKQSNFYAVDTAFEKPFIEEYEKDNINLYKQLNDLPDKNLIFDVIFLMDVIEHIENDYFFLNNLVNSKWVDDSTIFIITVPAYQLLFSSHDQFLKHFRRYNNSTIEKLSLSSGLQTIDKGYFFFSLLFPRIYEVILEKFFNRKTQRLGTDLTTWKYNSIITGSIKNVLLIDYKIQKILKLFGIRLPGLSNYIVCKKPA